MAGAERALNFAVRVRGTAEAASSFAAVGTAAKKALGEVSATANAQSAYEVAVTKASATAANFGNAQALAKKETAALKTQLKAGKIDAAQYASAVQDLKSGVALFRAENQSAARSVAETTRELVAVQQAAKATGQGFGAMERGAARVPAAVNRMSGSARAGFQQLGFQINDVTTQLSLLPATMRSYSQIFAAQSGQVVQAVSLMAGSTSRFATFMTGPWGLAVTGGISLLGLLASRYFDAEQAADKTSDAHRTLADRLDRSKNSYDEVVEAVRAYNAEQQKATELTIESAGAAARAAAANLREAASIKQKLLAQLEAERARFNRFDGSNAVGSEAGAAGAPTTQSLARQGVLENLISQSEADIRQLEQDARDAVANVAEELAKLDTDEGHAIKTRFRVLRNEARESITDVTELRKELARLAIDERDALDRVSKRDRTERGNPSSPSQLQQATLGSMVALVKELFPGARITSTMRKGDKGSDHSVGRAIDFVPAGGMSQFSTAEVEKILEDAGIKVRYGSSGNKQLFGPGRPASRPGDHDDHFHFAFDGRTTPENLADRRERAFEAEVRRRQAFDDASSRLDGEILRERMSQMSDVAALSSLARMQVEADREQFEQAIAAKVARSELTEVEADELLAKKQVLSAIEIEAINRSQRARLLEDRLDRELAANDNEREFITLLDDFAKTTGERRNLQLRLLDLDAREERLKLEQILALEALGKATKVEADAARERLTILDRNYALRRESTLRETAGPGESFLRELDRSSGQVSERIDQIKVDAIEDLSAGLVAAIVNFRSLGDVAVSTLQTIQRGLLELAVERYLTEPLAKLIFPDDAQALASGGIGGSAEGLAESGIVLNTAGATLITAATAWQTTAAAINASAFALAQSQAGAGGSGGGGVLGSLLGVASGLFGGGGPSASLVGDVTSTIDANPGLFASGTDRVPMGRWFGVGENGIELMRMHSSGRLEVKGSAPTRRVLAEGNSAPMINMTVNVPERADPRRTASSIARSTQKAIARAARKGLA